jgi:hypothetical protein
MSEISVESSGGSLGGVEVTPSTGPGPLKRPVKELLPDIEIEPGA